MKVGTSSGKVRERYSWSQAPSRSKAARYLEQRSLELALKVGFQRGAVNGSILTEEAMGGLTDMERLGAFQF